MLELPVGGANVRRNCEGATRRDFLRVGTIGLFGLSLPALLAAHQAEAFQDPDPAIRNPQSAIRNDPSVILIWLDGGPSHLDMFDPKPDAPAEIRGEFK